MPMVQKFTRFVDKKDVGFLFPFTRGLPAPHWGSVGGGVDGWQNPSPSHVLYPPGLVDATVSGGPRPPFSLR